MTCHSRSWVQAAGLNVARRLRIMLLAVACLCGCLAPAGAQSPDPDALADRLLATPAYRLDAVLTENRAQLDVPLLKRILERSIQDAAAGKVPQARARAELADYIDFFVRDKKDYRGIGQSSLGQFLLRQGNTDVPAAMARGILERNANSYYGHILKARVMAEAADTDGAIREANTAARLRPTAEDPHLLLGNIYTHTGQVPQAKAEFDRVLQINPNNAFARDAVAMLSGTAGSGSGTRNKQAMDHLGKAEVYFRQKKYPEAIAEYRLAVAADPKFGAAWVYMGDAYFAQEDNVQAITCYKKAIEVDPRNRQAHRFLGDAYERLYDRSGNVRYLDHAIECFENALKVDPSYQLAADDLERARNKRKKVRP